MSKSTIRFRFTLNRGGKGGVEAARKGARQSVNAVLRNLVVGYANNTFEDVKREVTSRLERDISTEISFMAGQFKRSVIGIAANSPNGNISMAHPMAEASQGVIPAGSPRAGAGISWPARSDRYMDWKSRHGYGKSWFKNNGQTIGAYLGSAQAWIDSFGLTNVRIEKGKGEGRGGGLGRMGPGRERNISSGGRTTYMAAENSVFHQHVMTIRVSALSDITPSMLPGLNSGRMGSYAPNGRKTGLMGMLPGPVSYRLGGHKNRDGSETPYRHTVEPFLTFVLTRAVPNALFLRVEKGMKATGMTGGVRRR